MLNGWTDERRLAFMELLTEPKGKKFFILSYLFTGYATVIRENNLLTTLPVLGMEFEISLDVLVSSFTVPNMELGKYAEILRFTTTNNNCCNEGDRIVALFTKKDKRIHAITQIGEKYNSFENFGSLEVENWVNVQARQFKDTETGKVKCQYYT